MLDQSLKSTLDARGVKLPIGPRTLVMGIVNVTPDSFSDGGMWPTPAAAIAGGLRLVEEGADIIDVGGESTRPGHVPVEADEEIARAIPVVTALARATDVAVSIDTYKSRVAERALAAGARIVNDIWGLSRDGAMAAVIATHGAAVVIMHNREAADPAIDILGEVRDFFVRALERATAAGIREDRILLDPGIGFGKTFEQNLALLVRLGELCRLGFPLLLGVSRKSFIGKLAPSEPRERLPGTIAANVIGVLSGAAVVRVHDVAAHVQALRIVDAIRSRAR
jgi:dihydropteroate synthase